MQGNPVEAGSARQGAVKSCIAPASYSEGSEFIFWSRHWQKFFVGLSTSTRNIPESTNQATTAPFHILSNSLFTNHSHSTQYDLSYWKCWSNQDEIRTIIHLRIFKTLILKWISKGVRVWNGFIWFRIGSVGGRGLSCTRSWTFASN
jgi:hypothetical protein